jgi:CheY-like chemotaxis protein
VPASAPRHVLVVEDDREIREILALILEEAGYAVDCATNGLEALTFLRSGGAVPAVILLDLAMPIMNGIEFCAEKSADAALKDIPVVVMSAAGRLDARLAQISAQAFLKKPMTIEAVLETIERCST